MKRMLFVVFGCLALLMLAHSQDLSGFISIDCGMDPDSSYTDIKTKIDYKPDSDFIDTGINHNISEKYMNSGSATLDLQLRNVRSFPEGVKNCYTLPLKQGKDNEYLIRASFMYGNYDSRNQLPKFKLYLGVEEWDSVTFKDSDDIVVKEIIHVPKTDDVYVCLVNNGSGVPFISTLELRQLNNSIYKTKFGSLTLYSRLDMGSRDQTTVRYGDDVFDRIWRPKSFFNWNPISARYTTGLLSAGDYKVPSNVMSTAAVPESGSEPLGFYWIPDDPTQKFYVYMHFAEIEELQDSQLREFTISLNNGAWVEGTIVPKHLYPNTVYSIHYISDSKLEFSLTKTTKSTHPPLINALEIYMIKEFLRSPTVQDDVNAIKKVKSVYKVMRSSWQGDPCLPKNSLWDGLSCSDNGYGSPSILSLNLSSSNLTGEIDSSFSNLKSLEHMDLSFNGLTGEVPSFLSELPSLKNLDLSFNGLTGEVPSFLSELPSLKSLNLSGNNLRGPVPLALLEKSRNGSLTLSLDGNPDLCKTDSCEEVKKKKKNIIVPTVASIISVVVLLGALTICWSLRKRQQHDVDAVVKPDPEEAQALELNKCLQHAVDVTKPDHQEAKRLNLNKCLHLSYSEVEKITNNLQEEIGRGGSGTVYSGHLTDGTEVTQVAVKILSPLKFGFKQFQTEAQLLTTLHHKNLVSLLGYCDEHPNMVLIYEYMAEGNLNKYLSDKNKPVLRWKQRVDIAIAAAQGLEYLHHGCRPPIIHRDVKSENILLNGTLEAKVADFGWSQSVPVEGGAPVPTRHIVGTDGYLDPEYHVSSSFNEKSDVYSFGIVLLELVSGKLEMIKSCKIVNWVKPLFEKGKIGQIVDQSLNGEFDINSAQIVVETAMACVSPKPEGRPRMRDVVSQLNRGVNENAGSVVIKAAMVPQ